MENNEFKSMLLNSVNESMIPDLSDSIKKTYEFKHMPWYKRPLLYRVGLPVLAMCAVAAISIPVVSVNSASQINSISVLPDDTYSISTLALGNVLSVSENDGGGFTTNISKSVLGLRKLNGPSSGNDNTPLWDDFNNGYDEEQRITKENLKRAIYIINPYLYVGQRLLEENFDLAPDFFTHNHGWKSERYNYSFSTKDDFTCKFIFNETLSKDKQVVNVEGILDVDETKFQVKGNRLNVADKEIADISLRVDIPVVENAGLTFREKQNDRDTSIYNFVYDESGADLYTLDLCIKSKMMYSMPMPVASFMLYNNFEDDHGFYEFTLAKGLYNEIFITLNYYGREILIEVKTENGEFVYFLPEYTDNPFDNHGRH